MRWKECEKK